LCYKKFLLKTPVTDQVDILRNIAKQSGKRIRSLNLFDSWVCKSPPDPDCPWRNLELPGDFFRSQVSVECLRRKVHLRANADFMVSTIPGSFNLDPFSINRRNDGTDELSLRVSAFPALPVFADQLNGLLEELLNSTALRHALHELQLSIRESLHVYSDAIVLYLQRTSARETISAIEAACRLADQLPAGTEDEKIDLDTLPSEFARLAPLIRQWGATDDEERSQLLMEASTAALERLIKSVKPHLSSIDEYLNSFGTKALSEAAIALGALAEGALEAQLILDQRPRK
jgi:hypothetical protein